MMSADSDPATQIVWLCLLQGVQYVGGVAMAQPVACRQASESLGNRGSGYDALAEYALVAARTGGDQLKVHSVSLSTSPVSLLFPVDRPDSGRLLALRCCPTMATYSMKVEIMANRKNPSWLGSWS